MFRSTKTWIVLAALLTSAPTFTLAAGPKFSPGLLSRSLKAPTVKRTVAPSLNQALKLRPATGGSSQLQASRAGSLQSGNLSNSVRNLVSPSNNRNLNLTRTPVNLGTPRFTVDNNPFNRGTLPQTNPLIPSGTPVGNTQLDVIRQRIGNGNLRLNPVTGGEATPIGPITGTPLPPEREPIDNGGATPIGPITATPLPPEREPINDGGATPIGPITGTPLPPEREPLEPPVQVNDPGAEYPVEDPIAVDPPPVVDAGTLLGDLLSPIVEGITQPAPADGGSAVEAAEPAIQEPAQGAAVDEIDIELLDVRLIDAGSATDKVGPRLRLVCRNNGTTEVPAFHASVMVDLGSKISDAAHLVTVESAGIKPGQTRTIDVQLPLEVLTMTTETDTWARPFETLAAIIDSTDRLPETDEANNVLLLARGAIKPMSTGKVVSAE